MYLSSMVRNSTSSFHFNYPDSPLGSDGVASAEIEIDVRGTNHTADGILSRKLVVGPVCDHGIRRSELRDWYWEINGQVDGLAIAIVESAGDSVTTRDSFNRAVCSELNSNMKSQSFR